MPETVEDCQDWIKHYENEIFILMERIKELRVNG